MTSARRQNPSPRPPDVTGAAEVAALRPIHGHQHRQLPCPIAPLRVVLGLLLASLTHWPQSAAARPAPGPGAPPPLAAAVDAHAWRTLRPAAAGSVWQLPGVRATRRWPAAAMPRADAPAVSRAAASKGSAAGDDLGNGDDVSNSDGLGNPDDLGNDDDDDDDDDGPWLTAARAVLRAAGLADAEADLTPAGVSRHGRLRVVTLGQRWHGVPIEGAHAVVAWRGAQPAFVRARLVPAAARTVRAPAAVSWGDGDSAVSAAVVAWQHQDVSPAGEAAPRWILSAGSLVPAWRVVLQSSRPRGRLAALVDASGRTVLGARSLSSTVAGAQAPAGPAAAAPAAPGAVGAVAGAVMIRAEPRCGGAGAALVPLPHAPWHWSRDGIHLTDATGAFSLIGRADSPTPKAALVSLASPFVRLLDESAALAGPWDYPLAPLPAYNDLELDDVPLAQADALVHVLAGRAWVLAYGRGSRRLRAWTRRPLPVHINVDDTCNAFYDQGELYFFREGGGCMNTARSATVVLHEYAHAVQDALAPDLTRDAQVDEGMADFVAAHLTGNPQMHGIFSCEDNFRTCVNDLTYCAGNRCHVGPDDEGHDAGQVLCAAWWELGQSLAQRYGTAAGRAQTSRMALRFMAIATDMDTAYEAALAADDDDDDNPRNGTAHSCEINAAFAGRRDGRPAHFPRLRQLAPCRRSPRP